jgi:hypothetical protein
VKLNRRAFFASIAAAPLFARVLQRPPAIDPDKEVRAHQLALQRGLMSRNDVVRSLSARSVFEEVSFRYRAFEALSPGLKILFTHSSGEGHEYEVKSVEGDRVTAYRRLVF